uniref:Uncharacterized protein n=1 Tax=Fagus sylvatica TaxID=28930 RepID=A0A2N9FXV8_FAGSY
MSPCVCVPCAVRNTQSSCVAVAGCCSSFSSLCRWTGGYGI